MLENDRELYRIDARRRLLLLGGFHALLLSAIGMRLFHLQILKGGDYRDLAENNRISLQPIPAPRGRILDRFGQILVENRPDYILLTIPELARDLKKVLEELKPLLHLSDEEIQGVLKQAKRQRSFLPVKVKSHLTWDDVSRVESRIHLFPGMIIQNQPLRFYPFGNLACHLLGYLGEVSDGDKKALGDINFRSGDVVGKNGVERAFERPLRGDEGVREVEVNALGREVGELKRIMPRSGRDLTLTLDSELQKHAEESLAGQSGAVCVMDPRTGEVLVMASQPSFDPNIFIRGITNQEWRSFVNDKERPLINKAVHGVYPPGSTFKVVVALAALASGRITPASRFSCGGFVQLQNHRFHCWRKGGHGSVDMIQALAQSCDVYFYRVAEIIGIDAIEHTARELGLGELSGVGLDGERPGLIPGREWKQAVHGAPWFPGETLVSSIGQGYVLTTPLQLCSMIATVANGGTLFKPTLERPENGATAPVRRRVRIKPEHLAVVKQGLDEVVNGARGTAFRVRPRIVRAAGKTGTSQVVRLRRGAKGEAINSKDRQFQDHALFVCFAPLENPELAIAVVVEHGGHGSSAAAPVATRIIERYFARNNPNPLLPGG